MQGETDENMATYYTYDEPIEDCMESPIDEFRQKAAVWYAYLGQGKVWYDRAGQRLVIADMPLRYRENCCRFLERRARNLETWYTLGEIGQMHRLVPTIVGHIDGRDIEGPPIDIGPEIGSMADDAIQQSQDERARNPERWLRTTELYRALAGELE